MLEHTGHQVRPRYRNIVDTNLADDCITFKKYSLSNKKISCYLNPQEKNSRLYQNIQISVHL